jgi:hypothetical protein
MNIPANITAEEDELLSLYRLGFRLRSGVSAANLEHQIQRLLVVKSGSRIRCWALGTLEQNQAPLASKAPCGCDQRELFALAFAILRMVVRATVARARTNLRTRWRQLFLSHHPSERAP